METASVLLRVYDPLGGVGWLLLPLLFVFVLWLARRIGKKQVDSQASEPEYEGLPILEYDVLGMPKQPGRDLGEASTGIHPATWRISLLVGALLIMLMYGLNTNYEPQQDLRVQRVVRHVFDDVPKSYQHPITFPYPYSTVHESSLWSPYGSGSAIPPFRSQGVDYEPFWLSFWYDRASFSQGVPLREVLVYRPPVSHVPGWPRCLGYCFP